MKSVLFIGTLAAMLVLAILFSGCTNPTPAPVCGDKNCGAGETITSCPKDCNMALPAEKCGNGICEGPETSTNCPADCSGAPAKGKCGDGTCEGPETAANCPTDCNKASSSNSGSITKGFAMGFGGIEQNGKDIEQNDLSLFKESGATWMRRNCWFSPEGSFILEGGDISILVGNDINLLNTIEPSGDQPPSDYTVFKEKLRELVLNEKAYVKYWQLGNEPDLMWAKNGKTEEDYVTFFLELQPVIREACPECIIVLGSTTKSPCNAGNKYDYFKKVLTEIRARSPDAKPFDVFDFHLYPMDGAYTCVEAAAPSYRALLTETGYDSNIEFTNSETGVYSGLPNGGPLGSITNAHFQSEQTQAKMLVKFYAIFFNSGVSKIFWLSLINPYKIGHSPVEGGVEDLQGLAYNGKGSYDLNNNIPAGTKKEAFYAYKTLTSKVQGMTQSEKIADYVYRFSNSNKAVYVAWNDSGGKLLAQISGTVRVTDYLGNEQTINAEDVTLTDSPVFIEEP